MFKSLGKIWFWLFGLCCYISSFKIYWLTGRALTQWLISFGTSSPSAILDSNFLLNYILEVAKYLDPCYHFGNLDWFLSSWLWPHPALVIVDIWKANKSMEIFFTVSFFLLSRILFVLCLSNKNKKYNIY